MRKVFLACPYGHDDPKVVARRFEIANGVAAVMLRSGAAVFSQVSMSHPINLQMPELQRAEIGQLWAPVDAFFMESMEELIVIDIDGWRESAGIGREIAFFEARGKRVSLWSETESEFTV